MARTFSSLISELNALTASYNKRLSSIDPFAIFGVSWNKSPAPTLTRTDVTNAFTSNVGVDSNVVVNDFDKALIWGEMKQVVDSLGNTFIRIPKCYIKNRSTDSKAGTYPLIAAKNTPPVVDEEPLAELDNTGVQI